MGSKLWRGLRRLWSSMNLSVSSPSRCVARFGIALAAQTGRPTAPWGRAHRVKWVERSDAVLVNNLPH